MSAHLSGPSADPGARYQAASVQTAAPGQLVVMCYDALSRYLAGGQEALAAGRVEEFGRQMVRAQAVVAELLLALDLSAGAVAGNLWQLYEYWLARLSHAVVKRDAAAAAEVLVQARDLREAWAEAARRTLAVHPRHWHF